MRERGNRPLLVPDAFLKPTRFVVKTAGFENLSFVYVECMCPEILC